MAHITILLLLAAVWTLGHAVPLQNQPPKASSPASQSGPAENEQKTISDIIQAANAHVSRPLIQGDIAQPIGRSAMKCESCRWDLVDGVAKVPFVISAAYNDSLKNVIRSALEEFSTVTCILFVDRTSEKDYIRIDNIKGCWSFIGKLGGEQTISLHIPGCINYGVIQHEVMHALSFFHEHNRQDRDNYVDIMWQYISSENQKDFKKAKGDSLKTMYNYNSVMHYGSRTFSNTSGMPSIIPKPDPSVSIGQRYGLSGLDVISINRAYGCNLCRTKMLGASGTFSSRNVSPTQVNDNCLWLLQVPSNKVFLKFNSFTGSSKDCDAKIIVYDGVSKTRPILATISPAEPRPLLISTGVFMLVEYIIDKSCFSSFDASYSSVTYGATFTSDRGSVVSPKYPSFYPNNVKQTSIIIAPNKFKVSVSFALLDLESSPSCSSDYLVIRDGGDTSAPILGTYCGQKQKFFLLSTGQMMLFQFSSNTQNRRPGFKADYTFVPSN